MKKSTILTLLLITQSLNPFITAHAGPGHDHNHGDSHGEAAKVNIPETRAGLWAAIQAEHAALRQAVETEADGAVHDAEGKLQTFLKALPEKVADLEEGVRQRIAGQTRNLARAYDAIHHAADEKVWDQARAELKKTEGGMKLLAAQMPE